MKSGSSAILRVGVGIAFLWIGILIYREPEGWGTFIRSWAVYLLPGSIHAVMLQTATLDVLIGLLLVIGVCTWIGALLAAIHLILVLAAAGINDITVRDIGLLAASIALVLEFPPPWKLK